MSLAWPSRRFVRCSAAQTAEHLAYLLHNNRQTPYLHLLLQLGAPLTFAEISPDELGALDTFWTTLRQVRAITSAGRDVFRVCDSVAAMQSTGEAGSRDMATVAYFTNLEAAGQLVERITLQVEHLETGPNLRIIDGNHQAVAIFDHARRRETPRQVRVYLVGELPQSASAST